MTRAELLRELRECASLEDREIARARADEAMAAYCWGLRIIVGDRDEEVRAAYKAAIRFKDERTSP